MLRSTEFLFLRFCEIILSSPLYNLLLTYEIRRAEGQKKMMQAKRFPKLGIVIIS